MDNASKAFYWGGCILIGMLIISIFYFIFSQASILMGEAQPDTEQKELMKFNKSFEAYNKKIMYGADIITLMNKAIDNNEKYYKEIKKEPGQPSLIRQPYYDYYVDIEFEYEYEGITRTYSLVKDYYLYNGLKDDFEYKDSEMWTKFLNPEILSYPASDTRKGFLRDFKLAGFKCTGTRYKTESELVLKSHGLAVGRLCKMTFGKY